MTPRTEQRNPSSKGLDKLAAADVIALMDSEEHHVMTAVARAGPALSTTAERVARAFMEGGRIVLIGAGTSGRIAAQEIAELPPTFGVDARQFIVLAAGSRTDPATITATEDDIEAAPRALGSLPVCDADVVIGVAASGTTPFVRAGLQAAASAGAWTCGIANNPGSPILHDARLGILLDTGPEILTGSTRLKAGTAQKLALNRVTTAAMVLAGRVLDNYMVDLNGSNSKFRQRSIRIVMDLAGVDDIAATTMLESASWSVRAALRHSSP